MNKLLVWCRVTFDEWFFNAWRMDRAHAVACRLLLSTYLLFEATSLGRSFEGLPCETMVSLPGPFSFLSCYPPSWVIQLLTGLHLFSVALLLFGVFPVWSGAVACLARIALDGAFYSLAGKIDHVLVGLLALPLVGVAARIKPRQEDSAWPYACLAFCIGFVMFTSGLYKLRGGWLSLDDSAVYGHIVRNSLWLGRDELLATWASELRAPLFWELQDYVTVVVELGFLVVAFVRRWFRLAVLVMTALHIGIALTMNICFTENLVVYSALVRWSPSSYAWVERVDAAFGRLSLAVKCGLAAVVVVGLFVVGAPAALLGNLVGTMIWQTTQLSIVAAVLIGFIIGSFFHPSRQSRPAVAE